MATKGQAICSAIVSLGVGLFIGYKYGYEKAKKEFDERMKSELESMREERRRKRREKDTDPAEEYRKESDIEENEETSRERRRTRRAERPRYDKFYKTDPAEEEYPQEEDSPETMEALESELREGPILTTQEEIDETIENPHWYDYEDITYFEGDDTFCDENDELVNDPENVFGILAIRELREKDTDPVYVLCEKEFKIYVITRNTLTYSEYIGG